MSPSESNESTPSTPPIESRQRTARGPLLKTVVPMIAGAAVMWGASRMTWVQATVEAEQLGAIQRSLTGSQWSPELTAIALGMLAMAGVLTFTRGTVARVIGVLATVFAALAVVPGLLLLFTGPDPERIHTIVTSGAAFARTSAGTNSGLDAVPEWAVVTAAHVVAIGPLVATLGAALALLGAVVAVTKPRPAQSGGDKYRTPNQLREAAIESGDVDPQDEDRLLWDSLDAGDDPTDK